MQRQCVHRSMQFRLQQLVQLLMTFDFAESVKLLRNHHQLEVRVGTRPRMHMAFIVELQQYGLQSVADFLFNCAGCGHGNGVGGFNEQYQVQGIE